MKIAGLNPRARSCGSLATVLEGEIAAAEKRY
jgi:hypothetical protein